MDHNFEREKNYRIPPPRSFKEFYLVRHKAVPPNPEPKNFEPEEHEIHDSASEFDAEVDFFQSPAVEPMLGDAFDEPPEITEEIEMNPNELDEEFNENSVATSNTDENVSLENPSAEELEVLPEAEVPITEPHIVETLIEELPIIVSEPENVSPIEEPSAESVSPEEIETSPQPIDIEEPTIEIIEEEPARPVSNTEIIEEEPVVDFHPIAEEIKLNTPQERLKYWIHSNFPNVSEFSRAAGMNRSSVYEYIPEGTFQLGERLRGRIEKLGLNLDWYFTGKGPMFNDFKKQTTAETFKKPKKTEVPASVNSPQGRLKKWIQGAYPKMEDLTNELGVSRVFLKKFMRAGGEILSKRMQKALEKRGLDLNWYLHGEPAAEKVRMNEKVKKTASDKKDNQSETETPQLRLKNWIKENFETVSVFSRKFGAKPSAIYNHTCTGGAVYKKEHLEKLNELGLDIDWYLNGTPNKTTSSVEAKSKNKDKIASPINVVVEPPIVQQEVIATEKKKKKTAIEKTVVEEEVLAASQPPLKSFTTMLEEYDARESRLIEERLKIELELEKVQAIKTHLVELNKLLNL